MSAVQIRPPRPVSADVAQAGRATAFQAACCPFEAGRSLRLRRLARLARLSGLNPVMSETTWGFDPLSLRHLCGERSLIGKAPGCDPVRCRFKSGRPPQPFLLTVAQLEERRGHCATLRWLRIRTRRPEVRVLPGRPVLASTTAVAQRKSATLRRSRSAVRIRPAVPTVRRSSNRQDARL